MINCDSIIDKIKKVVDDHYLGDGAYSRYRVDCDCCDKKSFINEYGCADAINILYSINATPKGAERDACISALRGLQHKETGLFEENTHHFIHTTAHCIAALEIFDADEGINDLHRLFGFVCCSAELQSALPGEIVSSRPLRLVLDRSPFI